MIFGATVVLNPPPCSSNFAPHDQYSSASDSSHDTSQQVSSPPNMENLMPHGLFWWVHYHYMMIPVFFNGFTTAFEQR